MYRSRPLKLACSGPEYSCNVCTYHLWAVEHSAHTVLSALGIACGGTLTVSLGVQVGPLYVLVSIVAVIFFNLGKRGEGEASAYSIFNGFRELPGQLNAGVLDDQIRRGQM